jgi:hypothetical protein
VNWETQEFLKDVIRAVIVILLTIIVLTILFGRSASAHSAPSGWEYDKGCCSNKDCAPLPPGAVQITPGGYVVTVTPQDNNQLIETKVYEIPFRTTGLRISGDQLYHICLNKQYETMTNEGEGLSGGSWLCLYVPPSGF